MAVLLQVFCFRFFLFIHFWLQMTFFIKLHWNNGWEKGTTLRCQGRDAKPFEKKYSQIYLNHNHFEQGPKTMALSYSTDLPQPCRA